MSAALALSSSWTIPQPADITQAYFAAYRAAFPGAYPDEPNTVMCVQGTTHGIVGFGLYLYQRSLADELMVDTARAWLARHANQWGVPQLPPGKAIGAIIIPAANGSPIPKGIEVAGGDGTQWISTAAGVADATNTATVPVVAEVAGTSGNLPAGQLVTIVSPVPGLQNTAATVAAGGLAGGIDIEDREVWRGRIKTRIRKRGRAGSDADYVDWASSAGAASSAGSVQVLQDWVGPGSVGVAFAMPNPAGVDRLVPTAAQVAAMQAALDTVRPVTAQVIALAAVQTLLPLTIALQADSVANRALASTAAQGFLAAVPIGGTLDRSLLIDAIIQATGSGVEMTVPAANVPGVPKQMLALAAVTFVTYA